VQYSSLQVQLYKYFQQKSVNAIVLDAFVALEGGEDGTVDALEDILTAGLMSFGFVSLVATVPATWIPQY
jgi:hypothetical protein